MQEANEMRERLVGQFVESYLGKLFYFSLKKTGNQRDAEDLSQDIVLAVMLALYKGKVPTNFSGWVWQIARNRYSVWAKEKHKQRESVSGSDIGDYEIEDEDTNILDEMIMAEQIALLRRELAFIKSEYRNIVVAYYIENRSVRDIASSFSLSDSAVWQRLHRIRTMLKEGMNMAREFGKRSYRPEDISFAASGRQARGLPWSVVQRKIPKNILLQANNNPSTIEELSVELGIALPYMEEEVAILHNATLLEKQGNRYITNFFILDKECRTEVYHALRSGSKERSRLPSDFIADCLRDIRAFGIAGEHITDNAVCWWLLPDLVDCLNEDAGRERYGSCEPPQRANGENWGFVGYETVDFPEKTVMGHNGCGNHPNMFWAYKYGDYSMRDQCGEPEVEWVLLMCDSIRNRRSIASFTDIEKSMWSHINGKYAHMSDDGYMIPDVLVITEENHLRIHELFRNHKNYAMLMQNVRDAYDKLECIFKKYSHRVLHESIGYYIQMEMYAMRMMSVHDLVEDGKLVLPDTPSKSSCGMSISF